MSKTIKRRKLSNEHKVRKWDNNKILVKIDKMKFKNNSRDPRLQHTLKTTFMWWELHLPAESDGPADNEMK